MAMNHRGGKGVNPRDPCFPHSPKAPRHASLAARVLICIHINRPLLLKDFFSLFFSWVQKWEGEGKGGGGGSGYVVRRS